MIQLSRDSKSPFSREMTTATLTLLIDAIRNKEYSDINYELNDKLTIDAIKYINEHLIENICVDAIARQLKVSPSTLMHTFKSNMNIPIHKYIIKKRLKY